MATKNRIEISQLLSIKTEIERKIKPYEIELENALIAHSHEHQRLNKPLNDLIELYCDQQLADANGQPIKPGDVISGTVGDFLVLSRKMYIYSGTAYSEPHLIVRQFTAVKHTKYAREYKISNTKNYTIQPSKILANGIH